MLLLIISLFSNYELVSCVNYEKAKFNESLLLNQHHQNFLQIKDFIKEAQHKFHEESSALGVGDNELESTRDDELLDHSITNWWSDNTSSIDQLGRNTPQTFLLHIIRSRPSFPFSITPYTTELNNRHLKWDEIFPAQSFYIRQSESRLPFGSKVSSPLKNPSLPPPPSKTIMRGPKKKITFAASFQLPKSHKCTRPMRPKTTHHLNTSVRGHSRHPFGPTTTLITTNKKQKKLGLREITTYNPVERWFQTLAIKFEMTTSSDYTTNRAAQLGRKVSKTQASVPSRQLKNDTKDQTPLILRQGISLADTRIEVDDHDYATARTATAQTEKFFIEDVVDNLYLRTIPRKVERRTTMADGRPAHASDVGKKVTLTEQDPESPAQTSRKSRRFHSKAKKRKHHHYLQKRHKAKEGHQNYRYKHSEHSNEDIFQRHRAEDMEYRMWRTTERQIRFSMNTPEHHFKRMKKVTRLTEKRRHREPTEPPNALLQYSERDDTDDEKLIKFIERRDESVRNTAQKDKTYFYRQVKESLKQAESKKKGKRLKVKAELLRKIVEGSSYSDEEASLTKNLIQALQYGNRT